MSCRFGQAPGKVVFSRYDVGGSCQTFSMQVDAQAHTGSTGRIAVPRFGANHMVLVNGAAAWNGTSFVGSPGIAGLAQPNTDGRIRSDQPR